MMCAMCYTGRWYMRCIILVGNGVCCFILIGNDVCSVLYWYKPYLEILGWNPFTNKIFRQKSNPNKPTHLFKQYYVGGRGHQQDLPITKSSWNSVTGFVWRRTKVNMLSLSTLSSSYAVQIWIKSNLHINQQFTLKAPRQVGKNLTENYVTVWFNKMKLNGHSFLFFLRKMALVPVYYGRVPS